VISGRSPAFFVRTTNFGTGGYAPGDLERFAIPSDVQGGATVSRLISPRSGIQRSLN